jgi:tetratricopeptide (TPR) repeat protein
VVGLALLSLATHAVATRAPRTLWGAHFYAFLPGAIGWLAAAGVVTAIGLALRGAPPAWLARLGSPGEPRDGWGARAAIGIVFAGVCWLARIRHLLLGDGLPLTASVLGGTGFHPYEPVSAVLQLRIYEALHSLFAREPQAWIAAWDALALGSCICGGLFAVVVWSLAAELTRDAGAGAAAPARWPRLLAALVLLSQGYVQLFFGYVENYSLLTLALALYLLLALQHLRGGQPLAAPGLALLIAFGLHMSALAVAPSFALLAAWSWAGKSPGRVAREVGIVALVVVAAELWLGTLGPGYRPTATLIDLIGGLMTDPARGWEKGLGGHLLDVTNEQMLIGPMAGLFIIAMLAVAAILRSPLGRRAAFLGAAAAGWLASQWVAGDSNLGYARNWDLLAPGGVVLAAGGLAILVALVSPGRLVRLLAVLSLVSLHHTAPWIAVNASRERALKRFESLDLGGGRTESTLGYWLALNGDYAGAEAWLRRSIAANPDNVRAHLFLGGLYSQLGRNDDAVAPFRTALRLRPDMENARLGLLDALVRARRLPEAQGLVDSALASQPAAARYWAFKAVILAGLDQPAAALDAASRAAGSEPGSTDYATLLRMIRAGAPFDSLVARVWPSVMGSGP